MGRRPKAIAAEFELRIPSEHCIHTTPSAVNSQGPLFTQAAALFGSMTQSHCAPQARQNRTEAYKTGILLDFSRISLSYYTLHLQACFNNIT